MRNRAILITLMATLVAAALVAADPQARPAKTSDLEGVWQMVELTNNQPANADDAQLAPYQIFRFDRHGKMKHMTSQKPFTAGQLALFDSAPLVMEYKVEKRGTLVLSNPSWDAPRTYQCSVVTQAEPSADLQAARAGDLVISGADGQGKILWSKRLRKLQ
jgi:hypothetical protein